MMRKENEISSKCLTVLLLPVMQIPIGNKLNDVILELGYIRLKSLCFTEKMVPNSQAALLEKKKVRKEGTRIIKAKKNHVIFFMLASSFNRKREEENCLISFFCKKQINLHTTLFQQYIIVCITQNLNRISFNTRSHSFLFYFLNSIIGSERILN